MSRLTKTSLLLAFFFALDKAAALLRQVLTARQFGLSAELDAFNVANNLPDMLFALISGGALAIAFIPVLSEVITRQGRKPAWELFSRVANLAFLITGALALMIAIFADYLVRWEIGVAPGFNPQQQSLVVTLMRMNLAATLVFSISGLVMAGLQANQHFLLPAMAPLFYNLGQIFGVVILAPQTGYTLAGISLPAFGLGINGLVYGVILGACLHLGIQVPGLIRYGFRWTPQLGLRLQEVQKVLNLLGPRFITMFFIQLTFIIRDNLASRLQAGSVSALTYGYMLMQLPETLIGTAIGTALLPTLAEQFTRNDREAFERTIQRAITILIGITIPVAAILSVGLKPLVQPVFGFDLPGTNLLMWVTRGYMVGLTGQCLLEIASRSFYAQQDALTPLAGAVLNVVFYVLLGGALYRPLGAAGISLADSLAFTSEAIFLLALLRLYPNARGRIKNGLARLFRKKILPPGWLLGMGGKADVVSGRMTAEIHPGGTLLRGCAAGLVGGGATWLALLPGGSGVRLMVFSAAGMLLGGLACLPIIWRDIRLLRTL